jgi:hypothetical protein
LAATFGCEPAELEHHPNIFQSRAMKNYSDFIDRIFLREERLLEKLLPTEPLDYDTLLKVRAASDAAISGGQPIGKPRNFALVRGGLLYALDAIDEAHKIFQDSPSDLGSYWHGVMHRREGDFDNARYWFRRAGVLPFFGELHHAASEYSALMARQSNWDPYVFTGECEQARYGETSSLKQLAALQKAEFEAIFDYSWRQSAVGAAPA